MKTFREFINENPQGFHTDLSNLISNLEKHGPKWVLVSKELNQIQTKLEKNIDDSEAQSDLIYAIEKLPNDRNILKLTSKIEDYLESL